MAADFIVVDKTKQHGNQVVRLANLIQDAADLASDLNDIASHQWDAGPDYTVLESQFGLSAGAGGNFLTLLGNTLTALQAANLTEFTSRLAKQ